MPDFSSDRQDLFISLAEQIKLPFIQIANATELLKNGKNKQEIIDSIGLASASAINLIDTYLLNTEIDRQQHLELEPVSVSSVLYDVADSTRSYAKLHGCELQLDIAGKYGPVMANRRALLGALTSLSGSFIEATSADKSANKIQLVLRRNKIGLNVGIFAEAEFSANLLKQAGKLKGKVLQPMSDFDSSSGAGVYLADELFSKLNTDIKVARYKGMTGLSATLTPSNQLSLV